MKDYIPRTPAAFNVFFRNICQYVNQQCVGASPRWTHIPRTALDDAYEDWYTAYALTLKPCTPQEKAEMRRLLGVSIKIVRDFVNAYLRFHPAVTDDDKRQMGLHVPSGTRTPVKPPDTAPAYDVLQKGPAMLGISYRDGEGKKGSRPPGVTGARIYYGVFDTPPADQNELPASVKASRCPTIVTFRETDRGRRAYFALRWEIAKGGEKNEGPWSELQSEIIP
jgi:hypothetical protein